MKVNMEESINITENTKVLYYENRINPSPESENRLLAYLENLEFKYIKIIQVIMYLGRETSESDLVRYSKKELFFQYAEELLKKAWSDKGTEIRHIVDKRGVDKYLEKGLNIVKDINLDEEVTERSIKKRENAEGDMEMSNYYRVDTCKALELNSYLEKGWESIGHSRHFNHGEISISYHIGYPMKSYISGLQSIIKKYEEYGLFDELRNRLFEAENIQPDSIRESKYSEVRVSNLDDRVPNNALEFLNMYKLIMSEGTRFEIKSPWEMKLENKNHTMEDAIRDGINTSIKEEDLPF